MLLLACAPVDQAYVVGTSQLVVEPTLLDFGEVGWDETAERLLWLDNPDTRKADIELELKGRGFTVERRSLELEAGASTELPLWFKPYGEADASGELLVMVDELLIRVELLASTAPE
jgi:hypothetical protein